MLEIPGTINTLIFDLDDTLIKTRDHYRESFERFIDLMEGLGFPRSDVAPVFDRIEMDNNKSMGVSPARYPASMKMTYQELCAECGREEDTEEIEDIEDCGWKISRVKYSLMPGAKDIVKELSERYRLILVTRGEDGLQGRKIRESGLEEYFCTRYIVPRKTDETFREILEKESLSPEEAVVIGDSIPADINPALNAGMTAIHIPYQLPGYSWPYEDNASPERDGFVKLWSLSELLSLFPGRMMEKAQR